MIICYLLQLKYLFLIIAVIGTHDDESDRVVMEVLNDVIKDDLE